MEISGIVQDSDSQAPLEGSTVSISAEGVIIGSTHTTGEGRFEIPLGAEEIPKTVICRIEKEGYQPWEGSCSTGPGDVDLGPIHLSPHKKEPPPSSPPPSPSPPPRKLNWKTPATILSILVVCGLGVWLFFRPSNVSLTVKVVGQGKVTSSPVGLTCADKNCSGLFRQDTVVTLTAVPAENYKFKKWGGDCTGEREIQINCTITLSGSRRYPEYATFVPVTQVAGNSGQPDDSRIILRASPATVNPGQKTIIEWQITGEPLEASYIMTDTSKNELFETRSVKLEDRVDYCPGKNYKIELEVLWRDGQRTRKEFPITVDGPRRNNECIGNQ